MELIKVIDGLYYFKLILPPHGFGDLNCFVIPGVDGGRNLLIDTGSYKRHYRVAFFAALKELNFTPDNTDIFISHNHSDHTGNVNELSELGYRILIGRIAYEKEHLSYLADPIMLRKEGIDEVPEGVEFTGKIMTCDLKNVNVVLLEDGDELRYGRFVFRCILTPGHSVGHLCMYEDANKIMFLGDHVLYDTTPAITRNPFSADALQDYFDSLYCIAAYDVELTLATHGEYNGNLRKRVEETIAHHSNMLSTMARFVAESPGETGKFYAEKMNVLRFGKNLTETSSGETYFALYEGFAWLDHLVNRGQVIRSEEAGVRTYSPARITQKDRLMNLYDALKYHAKKYSLMEPADAVKLVYQNEFGGEYTENDLHTGLKKLKQEMRTVTPDENAGLFEPIGNGFMRVNLAALPANDISVYTLDSLYVLSSKMYGGSPTSFAEKLEALVDLNRDHGFFAFPQEELEHFVRDYIANGCNPIAHSEAFKKAYAPAYRVVHQELLRLYVFDR